VQFQGIIGQAYNLPNKRINCQRLVNWYLEADESGSPKENAPAWLKNTPGYRKLYELGTGPIRLIHFDGLESDNGTYAQVNRLFVVSGSEVFRVEYGSGGWDILSLGSLGTSSGPVSAASLEQDYGVTIFVDGSDENYVYRKDGSLVETFQTFTAAGYVPVERATQVRWLDGRIIFIIEGSNQYYWTEWATLTVDALSFATAEGNPDTIVAVETLNRQLWFFNQRTVEIHDNTGNPDAPFERNPAGYIENGCLAPFSVAKIGGVICWLGRDEKGQGQVFMASGPQHKRISTHAIETAIAGYENVDQARGYAYQDEGRDFYCLNFAETTWVYDITTGLWHERCYLNDGELERDRIQCHAFFPNYGGHIGGDYANAKIYLFDNNYYTHDTAAIKRLRSSPHVSSGGKNIQHKALSLDMEVGVGLDGATTTQGYDPQIMMRFSDDGGYTWSNEKWRSIGQLGKRKTRVFWRQLGLSRDRVYEVSMTDPVRAVIASADLEAIEGTR
jgi:hypothetical protein